jgi:hypothetical protein
MVGQARIGVALGLLLFCSPAVAQTVPPHSDAPADDAPVTAGVLQLEAGFRYGFDLGDEVGPWGPGIGIGIGYTLDSGVYLGGRVEYFFGESGRVGADDIDRNLIQVVGEGGYDLALSKHWVARGKGFLAGTRIAKHSSSTIMIPGGGSHSSDSASYDLGFGPGASLMYLGRSLTFSIDGRYEIVLSDPRQSSIILAAGIGF